MSDYIRAFIATCEAFGWEGGPSFNTRIVTKANGRERRNADWDQPQHAFTAPFMNILQEQYAPIKEMHLNRRGAWGCFLYRNRLDDTATNELFAVAEPGQTEFQLSKWSVLDGVAYQRKVFALYTPDPDSPGVALESPISITADGTPIAATVDPDRGLVVTAPMSGGEIMRWTGQFSLWVRFRSDSLPFSIDNKSGGQFVVNGSVDLLEMPPPDEPTSSGS